MSAKLNAIYEIAKMFSKTGVNTIVSTSPDDVFGESKGGIKEYFGGKDTIKGEGIMPTVAKGVNAISRGLKFLTIDILHKVPMIATSAVNFADALDITSSQLAKMDISNGADATTIFKDALKIEPETDAGKIARLRAQQDTFRVLNINNSPLAEASAKFQGYLNEKVPTLGNYIIPMAKVPSNVIYNSLENAGLGLGTGTYDIIKGTSELSRLKDVGQENTSAGANAVFQIRDGVKTVVRTVGVMGAAAIITMNLKKQDFQADSYGNTYVRLGNYWLNTDAFGAAGMVVSGMMLAKTGSNGMIFDYGKTAYNGLKRSPIVDGLNQAASGGITSNSVVNAFINPIMAQDVEKSVQEKTANPFFFGSLIRTEAQVKQQDRTSALKTKQNAAQKARQKAKGQTFF